MKLLTSRSLLSSFFLKGAAATIGNFDGIHLGHRALLKQLREEAVKHQLPILVILFEPQPIEYLRGAEAPARLSSLREKLCYLKEEKVDFVYCIKFNKNIARMSAKGFIEDYLFARFHCKYLLVGEDFRFGQGREGHVGLLQEEGAKKNCRVEAFQSYASDGNRVSSTLIRQHLANNELHAAAHLLGRPFSISGKVIKGLAQGRQWGIPTANLKINRRQPPLKGVFCVEVQHSQGQRYQGVANLGLRPTLGKNKYNLEVHLFDFEGNIYGENLEIFFLHALREEKKFASLPTLIAQIHEDIRAAKAFFALQFS